MEENSLPFSTSILAIEALNCVWAKDKKLASKYWLS